uniref:Reverse transcriptase domain-containing protein n=1 Tax=Tanacetum cinerariifolium TaxID=118510 RepID=A0A699JKF6_TANCI|nr:reverse transcriptase domain-containing protein [Tanacetum cinerariifolium]
MEELCQSTMNGRGRPIAPVNIQATDFGMKNHMIQQNGVTDDALLLYLFPYSLTHHATAWFDRLPKNSIHTFQEMASKFLSKYFPPSMVTKLRNDINNFCQLLDESLFKAWERYKLSIDRCPNHNMLPVTQIDTSYNGLILRHRDTINAAAGGTFMKRRPEECYDLIKNINAHYNDWDTPAHRVRLVVVHILIMSAKPSVATLRTYTLHWGPIMRVSGATLAGPFVPPPPLSSSEEEKLLELSNTPLNKNCSAVLLKKLPKKLRDTRRFLIPCDFYGLESCMALANLGSSINLMPLYIWKKLSLPELTPTRMTLKLATQTVAYPAGIAEDVFVQVGKFTFSVDFVVIDYDVDPQVPLILGRPFLRTAHALVDVYGEELTLRVGDEKLVFNIESTSKTW